MAALLTVPAARGNPPRGVETRPRQLREWIAALPLAHGLEAARKLYEHLLGLNATTIGPERRLQALELHHAVAPVVFDELEALYARAALPLGARAREALGLARALGDELASGHALVVAHRMNRLLAFGVRKRLPLLLHRVLLYLSFSLRASYKAYAPVPEGLWRRIHEVYLYAQAEGVAETPIEGGSAPTVVELYGETLLLALTHPYRLPPGEIDGILAELRALRPRVGLAQRVPDTPRGGHFLVPCDTDAPPRPASASNLDASGPNWRLLDTHAVVEKLRVEADASALHSRLAKCWRDPPRRAARRERTQATAEVCLGLHSLCRLFAHEPGQPARASGQPGEQVHRWNVLDLAVGGMKIRHAIGTPAPAVGEIMGVRLRGTTEWAIGAVRWMTALDDGTVQFGLELLAFSARSVRMKPTITSASAGMKPALLLSPPGAVTGESLATAAGLYSPLRELEVADGERVRYVRATTLLERTARFERFQFAAS